MYSFPPLFLLSLFRSLSRRCFLFPFLLFFDHIKCSDLLFAFNAPPPSTLHCPASPIFSAELVGFLDLLFSKLDLLFSAGFTPPSTCPLAPQLLRFRTLPTSLHSDHHATASPFRLPCLGSWCCCLLVILLCFYIFFLISVVFCCKFLSPCTYLAISGCGDFRSVLSVGLSLFFCP